MTERAPIERLQAAIEKLETLSGEEWSVWSDFDDDYLGIAASNPGGGREVVGQVLREADAHGIVTLHRTIDAQLAILRFAVDGLYDLPEFIALAHAILGSES